MKIKKENIVLLGLLILLVLPLVYAGNYNEGIYGSGVHGVGPESSSSSSGGGGNSGGSGGGSIASECTDNSACDTESREVCWNFKCVKLFDIKIIDIESVINPGQYFEVTYFLKGMADISDDVEVYFWIEKDGKIISSGLDTIYVGNFEEKTEKVRIFMPSDATSGSYAFFAEIRYQDYQAQSYRTIETSLGAFKLFDITFTLDDLIIRDSDELSSIVIFENFGKVLTPVELTFIILDDKGIEVHREKETINVQTEEVLRKSFKGLDLLDGKYSIILQTLYDEDIFDEFKQDFEIGNLGFINYFIYSLIALAVLIVLGLLLSERKRIRESFMQEEKWVNKHKRSILGLFILISLVILIYYLNWFELIENSIMQAISWSKINVLPYLVNYGYYIFGGIILLAILVFFIMAKRKKIALNSETKVKQKILLPKTEKKKVINFKKFLQEHKILSSIVLLILILSGAIYYLFYVGILTIAQFQDLWNIIVVELSKGYNVTVNWIIGNWLYIVIGVGVISIGFVSYIARKQLGQVWAWLKKVIQNHKTGFGIMLGIIILIGIIVYLFYSEILLVTQFQDLWNTIVIEAAR
jgi:hypothetical protein